MNVEYIGDFENRMKAKDKIKKSSVEKTNELKQANKKQYKGFFTEKGISDIRSKKGVGFNAKGFRNESRLLPQTEMIEERPNNQKKSLIWRL